MCVIEQVSEEARRVYTEGDFYCSESVIYAVRKHLCPEMPESFIAAGSGFPVGIGKTQCVCGAIAGAIISLGYEFGRTTPSDPKVKKAMTLASELVERFKRKHKALCCRVLTAGMQLGSPEHRHHCIGITTEVAEMVAEIIVRERG